ncbi:MAG: PAS domain S-box protein [Candidatus Hodarchaeales archaeon]|jgi:PAS domain S-box-containing protein
MQEQDDIPYRMLLQSIQSPVLAIIADYTIFYCNTAYSQMMGKTIKELEGSNLLELIPGFEETKLALKISEVLTSGEVGEFGEKIKENHYHTQVHPTPWGVIALYRDVSKRKAIEQKLRESEVRFRSMIEQFPVSIVIHDLKGRVIFGNKTSRNLWKLTPEEYADLLENYNIFEDDQLIRQGIMPIIERGFKGEEVSIPTTIYYKVDDSAFSKRDDFRRIWFQNQMYPIKNPEGEIIEIVHVQQDITEQKSVEKILRNERDKAQRYLDIIPVIMIAFDLDGNITLINKKGSQTLGYPEIELIGKNYVDTFVPDRIKKKVTQIFDSLTNGILFPNEKVINTIKTRKGEERTISWTNTILTDEQGKIVGTLSSGEDITNQEQTVEKLKESEERYRNLVANSPEGIWVSDRENITTFVNAALENMLGYRMEEIIGKPVTFFLAEESLEEFESVSKSRRDGVAKSTYELTFIRKDGSQMITRVAGTILMNESQGMIGSSAILSDITAQKRAENFLLKARDYLSKQVEERTQDLNEEKRRIETIVEKIPAGIIVINNESKIYLVNQVFHKYYEKIYESKLPNYLNEVLILKNVFGDTISRLFYANAEETITIEPIKGLHLELASSTVVVPPGTHLGIVIVVRDVSPFVELDNLRKQFVSTVSHELRTPITGISLSIQNLQRYWDRFSELEKQSLVETISFSSKVLTQMVEDLLIASRIEAGKFNINWQAFILNETIDEVLIQMSSKRRERDIDLEVKAEPNINLLGDEKRIGQVLRILLDNAFKYSSQRSKVIIKVSDNYNGSYNRYGNEGVLIQVTDEGRGIPTDDLPNIFKRYYRSQDIADVPGSGVGLNIAKTIIEEHYGELRVKSEYGKGSTFIVFLPRITEIKDVLDRVE